VKILSWGLTVTENRPFIEMDFIEGKDLEDLLKDKTIFTITEAIKVFEHIAYALAHCHTHGIKHGDIKSNNIKFNEQTGNFILLDFGMALLTEEKRTASRKELGAIEFMAPEQIDGHLNFESDIYSLGIVLFELLTGNVPFPLANASFSARNKVAVAHKEKTPPKIYDLRKETIPEGWVEEKKNIEINVPKWLVQSIEKCLSKNIEKRFKRGDELYDIF
jgi:serine/threonine-protein kinase